MIVVVVNVDSKEWIWLDSPLSSKRWLVCVGMKKNIWDATEIQLTFEFYGCHYVYLDYYIQIFSLDY